MKKEKKNKKNLLQRYNDADAKKNVKYTAMKSGVDLVVGSSAGAGLGALLGIWSPLAGFLMIGAGHYFGDKSGVLRVAGAATIAYGIAKAAENRAATEEASVNGISLGSLAEGAKGRLINFKDNWLKAFYLDKLTGKKKEETIEDSDVTVGAIDLSDLDMFEDMTKETAVKFELQRLKNEDSFDVEEEEEFEDEEEFLEEDLEGLNYAMIEEEIDFSTI